MAARWTSTEDQALRVHYEAGARLEEIGERLGRSAQAVSERRRTLGISTRGVAWTAAEDALVLAAAGAGVPDSPVAQRLGRTVEQVRRRRRGLAGPRISPRPYSAADDQRLRAVWAGADVERLASELGRSAGSLRLRAQALGLHRPQPRRRWQPEEDAVVRDGYEQALSCTQIASGLTGRSAGAVAARAAKLGLATYARAWTHIDDRSMHVLAGEGFAIEAIAEALGRTPQAVLMRARRLQIALPAPRAARRSGSRWTAVEDDVLRVNGALNPAVLAQTLGRSPHAITQRMRRLGLRDGRSPHHPTARRGSLTPGERVTAARELRTGGAGRVLTLARRLDVSPSLIRAAAAQPVSIREAS